MTLSSKGGVITEASIKDHFKITEDEEHNQTKSILALMEDEKNRFEYLIPTRSNGIINTADLNFVPQVNGNQVTMTATLGGGRSLVQKYTLGDGNYIVDHALQFNGLDQMLDPSNSKVKFKWHHYRDRLELNTNFEKYYSSI